MSVLNDALRYIAGELTQAQRRAVVSALVLDPASERPEIRASEHTIRSLKGGVAPLVEQQSMVRYLTPLGREVARHINETGDYDIPSVASLVPVARSFMVEV